MKILHLSTFLQGGAGRVIADLAIAQQAAGHDVTVVASETGAPGYGNYEAHCARLRREDVPVHLVDSLFSRNYAANLNVVGALDGIFGAGDVPDVIHCHAAVPSLIALVYAGRRRQRIRVVQTMHGWGVAKTAEQSAADVHALNLIDSVVAPSGHAKAGLIERGVPAARIRVIPNGVAELDVDASTAADAPLAGVLEAMRRKRRRGVLVLACVGTVGPRKNQRLLIEAIAALPDPSRVFCIFVGEGETEDLRQLAIARGVFEHVRVLGYHAEARRIAAEASALVLPSRSEGQPISVLEAFADRTIVMSSDISELTELVDDGVTGLQFASADAVALASAIVRLARLAPGARRRMIDAARRRYESTFTVAAMAAGYLREYAASVGVPYAAVQPNFTSLKSAQQ